MSQISNQNSNNSSLKGRAAKIGGGVLRGGFALWTGFSVYNERRAEHPEESKLIAMGHGAFEAALWEFLPWVAGSEMLYDMGKSIGQSGMFDRRLMESRNRSNFKGFASWDYQDTQQASTMRQRATQVMAQSRQNVRSALGNEARSLHRGAF